MEAEPVLPVLVLVVFQVIDGISCAIPTPFIVRALDRVDCPARLRPVLPVLKLSSAVGLVAGLWVPGLGLVTIGALVGYFLVAIGFHIRARDSFVSTIGAASMLVGVLIVLTCFL